MRNVKDMQVVEVTWTDTVTADGWDKNYINRGEPISTIGYLCERSTRGIALVQSVANGIGEPYSASIFIPAGIIKKVKVIRKVEKS